MRNDIDSMNIQEDSQHRENPLMSKFTKESTTYFVRGHVCRWNIQKMQSESNEYERKTTGFFTNSWRTKIASENFFADYGKEVWESVGWMLKCRPRC